MLARASFITDNPFRLLAVPASLPYRDLSKLAQSVEKKRAVGITTPSALETDFGSIGDEMASVIARMAATPTDRIMFRLMWPQTEAGVALLSAGGSVPSYLDPSHVAHLNFLDAWIGFLRSGSPQDLESALAAWSQLQDQGLAEAISPIEAQDDRIEEPEALARVRDVFPKVTEVLLTQAVAQARTNWRARQFEPSVALLRIVLDSPLDDIAEARALAPIIEEGDDIAERIEAHDFNRDPAGARAMAADLLRLCEVIRNRHPAVDRWEDTLRNYDLYPRSEAPPVVGGAQPAYSPYQPAPAQAQGSSSCFPRLVLAITISICAAVFRPIYHAMTSESNTYVPPEVDSRFEQGADAPVDWQAVEKLAANIPERSRLTKELDELNKKHDAAYDKLTKEEEFITKESGYLKNNKPNRYSSKAVRAYNRRVDIYNGRLKKYRTELGAYEKREKMIDEKLDKLDTLGGSYR